MTTKEKIVAELSGLDEAGLSEVRRLAERNSEPRQQQLIFVRIQ